MCSAFLPTTGDDSCQHIKPLLMGLAYQRPKPRWPELARRSLIETHCPHKYLQQSCSPMLRVTRQNRVPLEILVKQDVGSCDVGWLVFPHWPSHTQLLCSCVSPRSAWNVSFKGHRVFSMFPYSLHWTGERMWNIIDMNGALQHARLLLVSLD